MKTAILSTERLSKTFSTGSVQQHVLKNLDIEVYTGDFTVIMGASGAGKSTLLYALSGMDRPTLGTVVFAGTTITDMSNDQLAVFRRKNCGFVFQQTCLLDNMSLKDNVLASGLLLSRDRKVIAARADELFAEVGLEPEDARKFPTQLSGGQAQRGALVRALINNPTILFADEPTGALNSGAGLAVLDLLTELNRRGQSIVIVTHDIRSAIRGNRILYLQDGSLKGELQLEKFGDDQSECGTQSAERTQPAAADQAERTNQLRAFLAGLGW